MVKDNKYFQPYNVITLCKNLSFFLYWKWDVFFPKIHIKDDLNLSYHKKKNNKQTKNSIIMVYVHNKLKIFMVREKLQQYEVKKKQ